MAYQRTARSIELRRTAVGEELEKLNYSILFSLEYLMPEVARFAPNTLTLWQQLYQQGIVGTTLQQNQQIAIHIQSINQSRVRAQQYSDSPQASETEAEASLEKVEQLVGTCQRDAVYSKAALIFSSRKKFQRAKEIAGNIEDMRQSENVKEIIFYDSILEDIEKGSFNEFEEKLKKINSSELKEIIYIEAAKELLKGNNKIDGTKYIYEAVNIAEKISEPEKRSGFLFALASILLKDDPIAAQGIINNAIKTLNKMEPTDLGRFFIQISIPLSCEGEDKNWYGDSVTIANSNVFDSISLFSKHNPDDARQIAENIDDKASKIRALAIITKIALAKAKTQK